MNTESSSIPQAVAEALPKKIIEGKKLPKNSGEATRFVTNIKDLVSDPTAGKDKTIAIVNNFKKELGKKTDRGAEIARLAVGVELGLSVVGSVKKIAAKQADMKLAIREEDELNNIDLSIFVAKVLGITGDLTDLGEYFEKVSQSLGIKTKYSLEEELSNRSKSRRKFLRASAVAAATVGLVAVGVSSNPFEKKPTTPPKTPASLPTPEAAPIASPVPTTKELTPPLPVPTVVAPEQEKLVPHSIRMLQNETLNRLWREGEIELRKVKANGREVVIIDYKKGGQVQNSDVKFADVYKENPLDERVGTYLLGRSIEVYTKQVPSTCAIHSFTNAAYLIQEFKDPQGTPVIINPFLLAEASDLTIERYREIEREVEKDESYIKTYGKTLTDVQKTAGLNLGIQEPGRLEKVMESVFGVIVNRNEGMQFPGEADPTGRIKFAQNMFSTPEWQSLANKYNIYPPVDGVIKTSRVDAGKIFGVWLEKWYADFNNAAEKKNQRSVPLFSLRYNESNINHLVTVLGIEQVNGRKYFRMIEPRGGELSPYLLEQNGVLRNSDGTIKIPLDKMWDIGIFGVYSVSSKSQNDHSPAILAKETPRLAEKEVFRTEQFGLRVNSVEAIDKLPEGIGIIRVAGNTWSMTETGEFSDPELEKMLDRAKQKGLKVVFVYNPNWFPGIEKEPHTLEQVDKNQDRIKEVIKKQMLKVLSYDNIILEIGNEPDETTRFWKGDIESFGRFFEWSSIIAHEIRPEAKIVMAAFADPLSNENLILQLVNFLRNSKTSLPNFLIGIHAYDPESLKWALDNLPRIYGKDKPELIVTEMNSDGRKGEPSIKELNNMLNLVKQRGVTALVHEFKPESHTLDYTGQDFNIDINDPRFPLILEFVNSLIAKNVAVKQTESLSI